MTGLIQLRDLSMATRKILYCGDPALRKQAKRVRSIDDRVVELLRDLTETMLENAGLGLAAPQVGEPIAAIVVRADPDGEGTLELINPRIVEKEGENEDMEGCLSLPTLRGLVVRPERVLVEAITREGEEITVEGDGLMARALAHETDHLVGRLFTDEVIPDSLAWLRPDDSEDSGYRLEPTTMEEAMEAFERLRRRRSDP